MALAVQVEQDAVEPDFASAEMFMTQAKQAHQAGDKITCMAALKLVGVALGLRDGLNGKIHTSHLARL